MIHKDHLSNIDKQQIKKFDALAHEWRNPDGKFATVMSFNQVRLSYIKSKITAHFGAKKLSILDVGCGAGLLTQPLAELGHQVLGIDASEFNVQVASRHGKHLDNLNYSHALSGSLVEDKRVFDLVLNTEVVEHVPEPQQLLAECGQLVRPGGMVITATLNRNLFSFLIGIVGAEYILKALPKGTHSWRAFVTPAEVKQALGHQEFLFGSTQGMSYNPLSRKWKLTNWDKVNYLLDAYKKEEKL